MPNNIHHALVLTETTFTERDYIRFGIATLSHRFEVKILDCTPLLRPKFWGQFSSLRYECPGYVAIQNREQFEREVAAVKDSAVAIDYLFYGKVHQWLRHTLRGNGVLRTVVFSSLLPDVRRTGFGMVRDLLRSMRDAALHFYYGLRCKLHPIFALPVPVADIAIVSGSNALRHAKSQARLRIFAHTFDYDIFLTQRSSPASPQAPYAVFLDQNLAHHTDTVITGRCQLVTEGKYFSSLNRFFDDFEKKTGVAVVIAAQPRAQYSEGNLSFQQRKVFSGKTAELVRGATIVFAHYSTAVSFPVMWRKPVVFLTTGELSISWIQPYIDAYSRLLAAPLLNIDTDCPTANQIAGWTALSESAYAAYQKMYIKMLGTPERPIWEIFSDAVLGRGP